MRLVLIYGLPGAGKSTTASILRDDFGYFWPDISKHPGFRRIPMYRLFTEGIEESANERTINKVVIEGVLAKRRSRDSLLRAVVKKLGSPGARGMVCGLREQPSDLAVRRNRSTKDYLKLESKIEDGSDAFPHFVLGPNLAVGQPAIRARIIDAVVESL